MKNRRGSLLWSTVHGDAILMYKAGDVVKPITVMDQFFTGVVRDVNLKTNKITVAWGNGPVSQHDADEIMPMPWFDSGKNSDGNKVATSSRRVKADIEDIIDAPEIGDEPFVYEPSSVEQTDFVPEDMEGLLNRQVGAEFYSAYLYYMAAAVFQSKGLVGFQAWMERQGDGEIEHAMKVYKYLVDTGSTLVPPTVPGPQIEKDANVEEITRFILNHEMSVTQDWKRIGQLAKEQDNPATMKLVQWFMEEQIEEEDAALTLHQKVQMADTGSGILIIDNDLKDRSPISVSASVHEAMLERLATNPPLEQYCGKPDTHGLNTPRGGGFSVMRDLAYSLHDEANEFADVNPRLAGIRANLMEIAHDDGDAIGFIASVLKATSGDEPSAQRTVNEENAKKSSVSVKATGEMSRGDIQPGGEYYSWAQQIEKAAREIQRLSKGRVKFLEMRPFDVYQGPYARMSEGKLWSGERNGQFVYDGRETVSGTPGEIALALAVGIAASSLRSRRAMYWCAPDRTFRLTKQEQGAGLVICPKCRAEMSTERFTRNEKLHMCPTCGFKVPSGKTVTNIEVKVPENVSVQVTHTDGNGVEVGGENTPALVASRRGKVAYVDPNKLSDLPRMSISEIAGIVSSDWKNVYFGAKPYLDAMYSLRNISDMFGMDSGTSVVAYFLANANAWRGEVARAVKKELQRRIR